MLIFINGNRSVGTINKNIYGHFAEHLGRCIYGGLYVGEDSEISQPEWNAHRCCQRSQSAGYSRPSVAGRLFCRHLSLAGRHRSQVFP